MPKVAVDKWGQACEVVGVAIWKVTSQMTLFPWPWSILLFQYSRVYTRHSCVHVAKGIFKKVDDFCTYVAAGVCKVDVDSSPLMILEYMPYGDLQGFLQTHRYIPPGMVLIHCVYALLWSLASMSPQVVIFFLLQTHRRTSSVTDNRKTFLRLCYWCEFSNITKLCSWSATFLLSVCRSPMLWTFCLYTNMYTEM